MKSVSSSWSFLRDSPELRGVLQYQLDKQERTLSEIGKEIGVHPDRLSKYFRAKRPSLTNYQIIKLANNLGINPLLEIGFLLPPTPSGAL